MEAAVDARDAEAYLSYVDLSDPVFAVEHTNWVNDWAENDYLTTFYLGIDSIVIDGTEAHGNMTLDWTGVGEGGIGGVAYYEARFVYDTHREMWLYGGEYWMTTETEYFTFRYAPGTESIAEDLETTLPVVFEDVTENFGHTPDHKPEVKLYESNLALTANTLLSLVTIRGWNEPAEAVKVSAQADDLESVTAHEFTHYLTTDRLGQTWGDTPWWAGEGIAMMMQAPFELGGFAELDHRQLEPVLQTANTTGLVDWELLHVFEETPLDLWNASYAQGYSFMRFVTDIYGPQIRNVWLALMGTMTFDEATQRVFRRPFDSIEREFVQWLEDPASVPSRRVDTPSG